MRAIEIYITAAMERHELSQNGLAKELGLKNGSMSLMRSGSFLPSDEKMLHLAELAGIDSTEALCDLSRWRAKDPKVQAAWSKLAKIAGVASVSAAMIGPPGPPPANATPLGTGSYVQGRLPQKGPERTEYRVTTVVGDNVYYVFFRRLLAWLFSLIGRPRRGMIFPRLAA